MILIFTLFTIQIEQGPLSVYWPGDGFTGTVMACDIPRQPLRYERGSVHIAMRRWYKIGCGTLVTVCSTATNKCAVAPVLDGGPYGIITGPRRHAVRDGRWKVCTKYRPPKGWRWRAVADMSRELWRQLGSPPALSNIVILYRH